MSWLALLLSLAHCSRLMCNDIEWQKNEIWSIIMLTIIRKKSMTPEEIKNLEERHSKLEEKYQSLLQLQRNIKQMKDMEVAGLFKSKKLGDAADIFSRHDLNIPPSPKEAREILKRDVKELQKEVYELYVDYGVETYAPWDAYENEQKRHPLLPGEYDKLKNKDQIVFIKNDEENYHGDLKLCGICLKIFELEINDHINPLENRSIKDGVYLEHKLVVDNDYGTYPTPVCFRGKIPRDMQDFLNEMKNVSRLRAIFLNTRYPRYLSRFADDLSQYLLEATINRNVDLFSSIVSNLRDTCFADTFSDIYLDNILLTVSKYGTTEMLDTLDNLGFGFDNKYRRDSVADIIRLTFDCSNRVNLGVFHYLINKLPSDSIYLRANHHHNYR